MVVKFLNWVKSLFSSEPKKVNKRIVTDEQFNLMKKKREDKMNSILDKISKSGYDSLSQHEKNFLNNFNNK